MPRVPVSRITPGMITNEEVRSKDGRFLLGKDRKIAEDHIRIFKIWAVTEVDVREIMAQNRDSLATIQVSPETLEKSRLETVKRFQCVDLAHPGMKELFRICVERNACRIASDPDCFRDTGFETPASDLDEESSSSDNMQDNAQVFNRDFALPSLPDVCYRIQEVIANPRSSAGQVAEYISGDPGISAKLLRLVNSPFYGFPYKIDSISKAVAAVGTTQLSRLAVASAIMTIFKDVPEEVVNMHSFWKHSVACGIAARAVSGMGNLGIDPERTFLSGLLHDIGWPIIFQRFPDKGKRIIYISRRERTNLHHVEKKIFKFDHAYIGGELLKAWHFPQNIQDIVSFHHNPTASPEVIGSSIIHLAEIIAIALMDGIIRDHQVPPLDEKAWQALKLGPGLFAPVIQQMDYFLKDVLQIFYPAD